MIRSLRRKTAALVAAALAFATFAVVPAGAQQGRSPLLDIPVVGTVLGGGTFAGSLDITSFATRGGELVAIGTLTGVLTTAAGVPTSIVQNVAIPAQIGQATCESCTSISAPCRSTCSDCRST